ERGGDADEQERRRVVEPDDEGVQAGEHGDAADQGLRDHADQHEPGEEDEIPPRGRRAHRVDRRRDHRDQEHGGRDGERREVGERDQGEGDRCAGETADREPQGVDERPAATDGVQDEQDDGDRDDPDHAGHQPVAELDHPVDALHLDDRDERLRGAQRPLGAAEAGAGQPHGAAGADDDRLAEERQPREDGERTTPYRGAGGGRRPGRRRGGDGRLGHKSSGPSKTWRTARPSGGTCRIGLLR
ncbi:unnamed protein product, partial [Penicillium discolor]